jgi:Spy/CpxP family protein refolding chaperone
MRTALAVVTLVVGMSAFATLPAATDEKSDQKGAGGLVERLQDLKLTDEQEAKVAEILKECKPKVQEAATELKTVLREEMEKIGGILTPEQKEKIKAHREERKEHRAERLVERMAHLEELELTDAEMAKISALREEYRPKVHKALETLHGLLTEEQRKAREEALKAGKNRREVLAALNLTNEQKEKVEAVGKEIGELVREHMEKVRDLLTESQKEKLAEFKDERRDQVRDRIAHVTLNLRDLDLTDTQKAQIMEVRKEYRPKVHEAANKLRAAVREELHMIINAIKA